jgi:hypothetical protein
MKVFVMGVRDKCSRDESEFVQVGIYLTKKASFLSLRPFISSPIGDDKNSGGQLLQIVETQTARRAGDRCNPLTFRGAIAYPPVGGTIWNSLYHSRFVMCE